MLTASASSLVPISSSPTWRLTMAKRTRVALIDKIPLFRSGVKLTLQKAGFNVIAESSAASDAIVIAEDLTPDVLLLELTSGSGMEVALQFLQMYPGIALLIIAASEVFKEVRSYLNPGVKGCVLKSASEDEIVDAVQTVTKGGTYVSPDIQTLISDPSEGSPREQVLKTLTRQELVILSLVANGATNKTIAQSLGLCDQTLKNYMTRIMKKISVKNRLEAALYFQSAK